MPVSNLSIKPLWNRFAMHGRPGKHADLGGWSPQKEQAGRCLRCRLERGWQKWSDPYVAAEMVSWAHLEGLPPALRRVIPTNPAAPAAQLRHRHPLTSLSAAHVHKNSTESLRTVLSSMGPLVQSEIECIGAP